MKVFHESRKVFPLLSFISTQKLKAIYGNLKMEFPDFDDLLRDVGFLFNLDINSCHVIRKVSHKESTINFIKTTNYLFYRNSLNVIKLLEIPSMKDQIVNILPK